MRLTDLSVGIDYHQAMLRVSVMKSDGENVGNKNVLNEVESVISYVSEFGSPKGVVLEACTGSANFADELRQKSGWEVELCHPGYVSRMRHNPDKSDKSDAWLLADLHRVGYLPQVWLAPEELRDLRTLVRHRFNLVANLKNDKLRIRALLRRERIKPPMQGLWSKQGMAWLKSFDGLLVQAQWVLRELIESIEVMTERINRTVMRLKDIGLRDSLVSFLMNQPGIGIVTATIIRAEIGTFTRFKRGKELCRFCAVTPRNTSSGTRETTSGLIKAGNPLLKSTLIQVGHNLRRFTPEYRNFAQRLLEKGKKPCVIVAAVTNRWLRKFFYTMRDLEITHIVSEAA